MSSSLRSADFVSRGWAAVRGLLWAARTMRPTLALAALLAACGPSFNGHDTGASVNENNGLGRILHFEGPPGLPMVGVAQPYRITRAASGVGWCRGVSIPKNDPYTGLPEGSYSGEECTPQGTGPTVVGIAAASCADGACEAAPDGTTVRVTGRTRGYANLIVTARMSAGPDLTDRFGIDFRQPAAIEVRCSDTSLCPGVEAVFTGAILRWYAVVRDADGRPIDTTIPITAEPADLVKVFPLRAHPTYQPAQGSEAWNEYDVTALRPGVVTLRATVGAATWSHTFRIASPSEATSGEVHLYARDLSEPQDFVTDRGRRVSTTFSSIGAPASEVGLGGRLVLAWNLTGGGQAISNARDASAITSAVVPDYDGLEQLGGPDVFIFALPEYPCAAKSVQLKGRLGFSSALIDWPLQLTCKG